MSVGQRGNTAFRRAADRLRGGSDAAGGARGDAAGDRALAGRTRSVIPLRRGPALSLGERPKHSLTPGVRLLEPAVSLNPRRSRLTGR
jgi:hypothetical protein